MKVHFVETKKDHFKTSDGRFSMVKSQTRGSIKFLIHDDHKDRKVGSPTSFTKAVSLVRHYLLEEKQAEDHPSTIPTNKLGDNVRPLPTTPPVPVKEVVNESNLSNAQILMSHLASIADKDGTFTVSENVLSRATGLNKPQIIYWIKKFLLMEWVIELESEKPGRPGSYGFSLSREEVQKLVQNMPTRIMAKVPPSIPTIESKPETSPSVGILAGRALVKINELEKKVDQLTVNMKEATDRMTLEIQQLRGITSKPDIGEFESILSYLEDSQKTINTFIHDTFGVMIT